MKASSGTCSPKPAEMSRRSMAMNADQTMLDQPSASSVSSSDLRSSASICGRFRPAITPMALSAIYGAAEHAENRSHLLAGPALVANAVSKNGTSKVMMISTTYATPTASFASTGRTV